MSYPLEFVPGTYAVCRFGADQAIPGWALREERPLLSITRSAEELSVVCEEGLVPADVERSGGWTALRVSGTLDHDLTGVLVSVAGPLADAGIPIFALSSHDTDFVLVPVSAVDAAREALVAAGHHFG